VNTMLKDDRIFLTKEDIPKAWYNVQADMPEPMDPPLNPQTLKPLAPEDLLSIFPMELIKQEASQDRWIEIPEAVREALSIWRPTPLVRARRLEKALDTPAKIYFKNESVSPTGSHKPNTAIPQAYYNKRAGIKTLTTETGAGQWGCSLALACNMMGLGCKVYMVKTSYEQKPYRRILMNLWGAEVTPSPSDTTEAGRAILKKFPDSPGSLGMAISEAVEVALGMPNANYALGSVLNHVLLHQSVIGLETRKQLEIAGDSPDIIIGCCGGGSNFGGIALPFLKDSMASSGKLRLIAVEPAACPSLCKGKYAYDFGDTAGMAPVVKMYTLGHNFVPSSIHAGGLRFHGTSPIIAKLFHDGLIEATNIPQVETFKAAELFSRTECIVPAPESSHAIAEAIRQAEICKRDGVSKNIVFCLSGHGHFDLAAYEKYIKGQLPDLEYSESQVAEALKDLPLPE